MKINMIYLLKLLLILSVTATTLSCKDKTKRAINIESIKSEKLNPEYSAALNFINSYVDFCNKKEAQNVKDWIENNENLTVDFKKEYSKIIVEAGENLDFDPIFNAQDYPDKGFEFDKIGVAKNNIVLKGIKWSDFKLNIKLKRFQSKWLVDGAGIVNISK